MKLIGKIFAYLCREIAKLILLLIALVIELVISVGWNIYTQVHATPVAAGYPHAIAIGFGLGLVIWLVLAVIQLCLLGIVAPSELLDSGSDDD